MVGDYIDQWPFLPLTDFPWQKSEEKQSNTRDFDENDREILRESVATDLFCAIYELSDSAGRY